MIQNEVEITELLHDVSQCLKITLSEEGRVFFILFAKPFQYIRLRGFEGKMARGLISVLSCMAKTQFA